MARRNFPEVFNRGAGTIKGRKILQTVEELAWDDSVDPGEWTLKVGPLTLTTREEVGQTVTSDLEVVRARIVTTEISFRR